MLLMPPGSNTQLQLLPLVFGAGRSRRLVSDWESTVVEAMMDKDKRMKVDEGEL